MSSKTDQVPFEGAMQVALSILESQDTPRSLAVYLLCDAYLVKSYEPILFSEQLGSLGFEINWYDQSQIEKFQSDYMATELLSKLPPKPGADTDYLVSAAIEGFKCSEAKNGLTNRRWSGVYTEAEKQLEAIGVDINFIRKVIKDVVGRAPSLQSLNKRLRWSVGASVTVARSSASAEEKCERGISITYPLAKKLDAFLKDGYSLNPIISQRNSWLLIPGNLFDTVLKNIKTNRTIAKEPDINMLFQLATGTTLKERLLRVGVDLLDQTLNQRGAMRAIMDRRATVDTKNASNSVCALPVYQTWPEDWVELLDVLRSPYGTYDTRDKALTGSADWFPYEMLSSMGNGFTFEVESVMFYALARAAGAEVWEIDVYGDDLILPQRCIPLLRQLFEIFGFEMNTVKSFVSGTFFESCGLYSFHGLDVSPIKIKDHLNGHKDRIILANKIRWFAHLLLSHHGCDRRLLPAWQMCIRGLPYSVRSKCRGPVGSGLTLWVNQNESSVVYDKRRCYLKTYQLVPALAGLTAHHVGVLIMRLTQIRGGFEAFGNDVTLNDLVRHRYTVTCDYEMELPSTGMGNVCLVKAGLRYEIKPLLVSEWYQLGWWR